MNEWIRVEDRLPEKGDYVIGYDGVSERVGEAVLCPWNPTRIIFHNSDDCCITHWQPMPEPPNDH
jgi:hypothetical protein